MSQTELSAKLIGEAALERLLDNLPGVQTRRCAKIMSEPPGPLKAGTRNPDRSPSGPVNTGEGRDPEGMV